MQTWNYAVSEVVQFLQELGVKRDCATCEGSSSADAIIIEQVIAGERDSYRVLVQRYEGQVFGMIMRQVQNGAVAEELAQETFIKAYQALASFRGQASFGSWLIRIALNHTSNYFRSRTFMEGSRAEQFELEKHEASMGEHPPDNLASEIGYHNRSELFQRALASLPPIYRDVLTLCGIEARSYQEAAIILEAPIGTIRSRLNTARLKVKQAIEQLQSEGEMV